MKREISEKETMEGKGKGKGKERAKDEPMPERTGEVKSNFWGTLM